MIFLRVQAKCVRKIFDDMLECKVHILHRERNVRYHVAQIYDGTVFGLEEYRSDFCAIDKAAYIHLEKLTPGLARYVFKTVENAGTRVVHPGIETAVLLDGGMHDNIRASLFGYISNNMGCVISLGANTRIGVTQRGVISCNQIDPNAPTGRLANCGQAKAAGYACITMIWSAIVFRRHAILSPAGTVIFSVSRKHVTPIDRARFAHESVTAVISRVLMLSTPEPNPTDAAVKPYALPASAQAASATVRSVGSKTLSPDRQSDAPARYRESDHP